MCHVLTKPVKYDDDGNGDDDGGGKWHSELLVKLNKETWDTRYICYHSQ